MVLRIEDVDSGRSRADADAAIVRDLRWLGFDWDEGPDVGGPRGPYRQSERAAGYEAILQALAPRLFRCSCSRKEIRARSPGVGELRYPGTCRGGPTHPDRPTSLRFRVEPEQVSWRDRVVGERSEDPSTVCGDFIVRAKNGDFTYQLACVADDVAMGITHVLRGEDLLDSTGRQLLLFDALGAAPPGFAHVPLRRDDDGQRLAKSRGSAPIADLRAAGQAPEDVLGGIAQSLGLGHGPTQPRALLEPFARAFPHLLEHGAP